MFKSTKIFCSFSVNDLALAKKFYGETLGVGVEENSMGLWLKIAGVNAVFIYSKPDHVAATYTVLNFSVDDIDQSVEELKSKGVVFEHYENMTDDKGIARGLSKNYGPDIAWFKDPAGNFISVLKDK